MCLLSKNHLNSLEFDLLFWKKYIELSVFQIFKIPVMLWLILKLSPQISNVINQELKYFDQKQRLRETQQGQMIDNF